jgi:proteic killer suppression protein
LILTFGNSDTEKLWKGESVKSFHSFEEKAMRKLRLLDSAVSLEDIKNPPGNRLEKLKGKRQGQHSVRINDQYRICFEWMDGKVYSVEIVDYHR